MTKIKSTTSATTFLCERGESDHYQDFLCGCKPVGRLNFRIPKFDNAVREIGRFSLETHSFEDIRKLTNYLALLEETFDTLHLLPITLGRAPQEHGYSYRDKETSERKRGRKTSNLLYFKYNADSFDKYMKVQQLGAGDALALPDGEGGLPQLPEAVPEEADAIERIEVSDSLISHGGEQTEVFEYDVGVVVDYICKAVPDIERAKAEKALREFTETNNAAPDRAHTLAIVFDAHFAGAQPDPTIVADWVGRIAGGEYYDSVWEQLEQYRELRQQDEEPPF